MPLHADKEGWNIIENFKRKLLKPIVNQAHEKFEREAQKREEEGWRRSTTQEIKDILIECMGNFNPDIDSSDRKFDKNAQRLRKLIDVFLVLYDSDDAYAIMFHKFVNKCNQKELTLDPDKRYYDPNKLPLKERLEKEYEETKRMDGEELENKKKKLG